ncbi:MAG: AI-2E family transporter [Bacteroidota bacterium]
MKNLAYAVIGIGGVIALLVVAENILIPLVYGLVLWFLSRYFKNLLNRIPFIQKRVPNLLVNALVFGLVFMALTFISGLITTNISALIANGEVYTSNFNSVLAALNERFHIDIYQQILDSVQSFDYTSILGGVADGLSGALGDFIMIILYAAFIFTEEASLSNKIKKLFSTTEGHERATSILRKINDATSDYIRLKTYVSLLTGLVGFIFLKIMGVDAAFFWAFLMFALNYIPTVGSLIATLFPAVFSLVQFGEITPFIIILAGLGIIEWFIGNVLEPRLMGSSLNLSPLVTILALIVWGQIWGITGMLLSTPITVVMVIIFSQFPGTRSVAILLSEKGEINIIEEEETVAEPPEKEEVNEPEETTS